MPLPQNLQKLPRIHPDQQQGLALDDGPLAPTATEGAIPCAKDHDMDGSNDLFELFGRPTIHHGVTKSR